MEIVMGIGEEGRPKACSSETGSAKQHDVDSGEKTLEENGARVSQNGEHKVLGHVDDNKSKDNVGEVTEKENLNDSGVIEDCVMNGVSSLLKLKQDVSGKEKEIDDEDEDGEEDEEEEHGYHVGDFVWGKIKNHPWWPGQIYDPSEASDLALKIKQKGKLLVAYFGDRTFAWCGASQLKPFAESFKECSNVSNSKGFFVSAVEEAVEEMGRHMERLLIRDCTEEKKHELDRPQVKNAGIKEGVVVPDVRREMISSLLVGKPEGILQDVKGFAETVSFSGLLELEIVKRKVSAFYRSKRGYGLIEYPEPQSVPGLEDKNNDDDDEDEDFDDGGAKRSTIEKGKEEEEEEALDPEESSIQKPLETCSGFPDHRLRHKRKQKSIADILENESSAKVRFETDGNGKASRKKVKRRDEVALTTTTPRRRRMKEVVTVEEDEENSKGKTFSRKRKKRDDDDDGTEKKEVPEDEADNDSTPLASLRKNVRIDASSAGNGTQTTKRERKKSKYFSPEYLSDFSSKRKKSKSEPESKASDSLVAVEEDTFIASNSLVAVEEDKLDKPCELLLLENGIGHQEELINAVDFLRLGATSEEIRDLIRVSALGTQYPKDSSSRDMVREFMSMYRSFTYDDGANSKFLGSYNSADTDKVEEVNEPESKGKERKYKKRKTKEQTEEIGKEENETTKKVRKPKTAKSKNQADEEEIRKESSETTKKERKRKKPESEKKADEEEEETLKESTKKERKAKKPKFEEDERQKKREGKSKKQEVEETEKEFSGAELFVTFGPGSSLPKREALIEIYGKFGALDEERTNVFDTNFCASIAFLNVADGEKAFESSVEKSPFASTSTVKFRLKYPNEKKAEAEFAETTMEMKHLKKKLEEMISLVDESEGGMTEEVKVKLENEMVTLLEKVRKMRSF